MSRIIASIRGALVVVFVPPWTLLISIGAVLMAGVLRLPASAVHQLGIRWGRAILRVAGVRVTVEGAGKLAPGQPYIFAANHQSMFDIPALQGWLGVDFRWLAKKELFQVPLWGRAMRRAGYIPVDRAHGRAALKSLDEAAERISGGTSVIIFPEGTRSRDGKLQPFKTGGIILAIKSGVPVVPMAIIGTHKILPKGRLLAKPGTVRIRLGAPVATKDYQLRQKHELAERLHDELARLLGQFSP